MDHAEIQISEIHLWLRQILIITITQGLVYRNRKKYVKIRVRTANIPRKEIRNLSLKRDQREAIEKINNYLLLTNNENLLKPPQPPSSAQYIQIIKSLFVRLDRNIINDKTDNEISNILNSLKLLKYYFSYIEISSSYYQDIFEFGRIATILANITQYFAMAGGVVYGRFNI